MNDKVVIDAELYFSEGEIKELICKAAYDRLKLSSSYTGGQVIIDIAYLPEIGVSGKFKYHFGDDETYSQTIGSHNGQPLYVKLADDFMRPPWTFEKVVTLIIYAKNKGLTDQDIRQVKVDTHATWIAIMSTSDKPNDLRFRFCNALVKRVICSGALDRFLGQFVSAR